MYIQVERSSKAHFIRVGNKSAQVVGCWQIGKILCQKSALRITHGRVKLLPIMLWKVPVKPDSLGHARRCTQHNGQGEDHSTAFGSLSLRNQLGAGGFVILMWAKMEPAGIRPGTIRYPLSRSTLSLERD